MALVAALSMAAAPALAAQANPAAKLSLTSKSVRASAPMHRSNKAAGSTLLLVGLAVGVVVVGAVAMSHSDSKPASA